MKRIGFIAGGGDYPLLFARAAKAKGLDLVCVALKDETPQELEKIVNKIYWISFGEVKKAIDILKKEKIKKAVMLGKVSKKRFFKDRPTVDEGGDAVLNAVKDKRDMSLFKAAALYLKLHGITIISCLVCLRDNLAKKGCLTKKEPSQKEWEDIRFGYRIAKKMAGLDIGQTVVVKDKVILAVEAMEGTDLAIKRAGDLGNGDVVVVKAARPNQDMRFDIPVIGIHTAQSLIDGKASCLAIEKDRMLILNKDELVGSADKAGVSIVVI